MELGSLFISLLLAAAGLLAYYFLNRLNYWKKRGIPHDPPHFLHGNFEGLKTKYHQQDIFQATYNKYKGKAPFVGFYFFQQPMAFIISLDLVKNILIKDFSNFSNRSRFYNEKHDPLSAHLFALDNPKWNQLRKKLTPTFTSGKMKFMFPTVLKVAEEFRDAIQKTKEGTSVDIKEFFARFTTDVIGTCAFGIECNSLKDPQAEFRIMGRRAFSEMNLGSITMAFATSYPSIARKLGIIVYPKDVTAFFIKAVKDTVDLREKNNIRRNDFMDMLIELKNKQEENITMEEIAAQAYVFFLAGFETSSTTSGFAMFELALHQDMQDRVRAEINEVLSRYNNEFSYESLKEMTYLDQVISGKYRILLEV